MKFKVHPSKISSNIERVYVSKVKLEIEWKCMIYVNEWINKFEFKRSEHTHTNICYIVHYTEKRDEWREENVNVIKSLKLILWYVIMNSWLVKYKYGKRV